MCRRKMLTLFLCTTMVCSMLMTGCGSKSSEADQVSEVQANVIQISSESVTGTVEEINGNTITLSVGSTSNMGGGMPTGDMGADFGNGTTDNTSQDMPSDDAPSGDGTGGTPPDIPSGDGMGGTPPEMPSGDGSSGNPFTMSEEEVISLKIVVNDDSIISSEENDNVGLADIAVGDTLTIYFNTNGEVESIVIEPESSIQAENMGGAGGSNAPGGGFGGGSSGVDSYDAVTEYTEDASVSGESFSSVGTDENAIHVYEGANVTFDNITVTRSSSDSTGGDNSSFYGVGASVLVTDGITNITGGTITTDSAGGAGVFAYGEGTAYVSNTDIVTSKDTSGGIHVAGGGTLYASNVNVTTSGQSSAAIRSDRGGGTMEINGGNYVSNGVGSPAVYCTADITVNDATLTANGSEGICIEGLNSLKLYDCDLTSNMSDDSQNDCTWNIIVYQSMSGDSEIGNSTFSMTGGSITAKNGGILYTTNTECTIYMSDVDITYADDNEFFLNCSGNANQRGWGTTGSNGSNCTFTADSKSMEGNILYDSISTLDFYMKNGSSLKGAIIDDESYAGNGGDGYCNVYISEDSSWVVTADSIVTKLSNEGTIVDEQGNTVSIVGTDGTLYVTGTSEYTITVSSYETSF